jgi:hypothetical protein
MQSNYSENASSSAQPNANKWFSCPQRGRAIRFNLLRRIQSNLFYERCHNSRIGRYHKTWVYLPHSSGLKNGYYTIVTHSFTFSFDSEDHARHFERRPWGWGSWMSMLMARTRVKIISALAWRDSRTLANLEVIGSMEVCKEAALLCVLLSKSTVLTSVSCKKLRVSIIKDNLETILYL